MKYVVVIEKATDGSYSAYVPDLPGCVSCGDTADEAKQQIREALRLHVESLLAQRPRTFADNDDSDRRRRVSRN